jgi:DNA adenine methylase
MKHLRSKIMPIHERLQTVIIEHLDWRHFLDRYDRKGVFMYVDPPYPGNHCNYAHNMRSIEDHRSLVERLRSAECRWLLSSFDKPEVRQLYDEFHVTEIDFASGLDAGDGSRRNREVVVTNYAIKPRRGQRVLSD